MCIEENPEIEELSKKRKNLNKLRSRHKPLFKSARRLSNFVFSYYPAESFIETGSYKARGIMAAVIAGYQNIYSIELNHKYYRRCTKMLWDQSNVHMYYGNSKYLLEGVMTNINHRTAFWLDSHFSGGHTSHGEELSPLMSELDVISQHHIKNHTIMIDNISEFHKYGTTEEEVSEKLQSINPNFDVFRHFARQEDEAKKDILIATTHEGEWPPDEDEELTDRELEDVAEDAQEFEDGMD